MKHFALDQVIWICWVNTISLVHVIKENSHGLWYTLKLWKIYHSTNTSCANCQYTFIYRQYLQRNCSTNKAYYLHLIYVATTHLGNIIINVMNIWMDSFTKSKNHLLPPTVVQFLFWQQQFSSFHCLQMQLEKYMNPWVYFWCYKLDNDV